MNRAMIHFHTSSTLPLCQLPAVAGGLTVQSSFPVALPILSSIRCSLVNVNQPSLCQGEPTAEEDLQAIASFGLSLAQQPPGGSTSHKVSQPSFSCWIRHESAAKLAACPVHQFHVISRSSPWHLATLLHADGISHTALGPSLHQLPVISLDSLPCLCPLWIRINHQFHAPHVCCQKICKM